MDDTNDDCETCGGERTVERYVPYAGHLTEPCPDCCHVQSASDEADDWADWRAA